MCFKAPGQGLAYIGADCSQRVCPYGKAHDLVRLRPPPPLLMQTRATATARPLPAHPAHAPPPSPLPLPHTPSLLIPSFSLSSPQISDNTQQLVAVSDADGEAKYVGYVKAPSNTNGMSILRAFLNGGYLYPDDLGIDLRVVSVVSGSDPKIIFQWKTNGQKVRGALSPSPCFLTRVRHLYYPLFSAPPLQPPP